MDANPLAMRRSVDAPASRAPVLPLSVSASHAAGAALFAVTLLFSSTLLFLVQPMFAKMVLPRLGGTAAVWNTCMVFFQACLLAGYAYAHVLTRRLCMSRQLAVHAVVLALPMLILPLALPADWAPPTASNPIPSLLLLLAVTVGLPFFVVSTTAPLIQGWFGSTAHRDAGDPYFLYAASNAGSMVALLGYPTLVEPLLRLGDQTRVWTWAYLGFAVLTVACGVRAIFYPGSRSENVSRIDPSSHPSPPSTGQRVKWTVLALVPSSYLLGVTTYITTDVAAVPLLWVLPLALYLLTFILAFARRPPVSHRMAVYALPAAVLAPVLFMLARAALPVWAGVAFHLFAFFVAAMVCHGELARSRPPVQHLTSFYLMMSLGGVLGGAFNALAAPMLFTQAVEYPIAIVLACFLCPPRAVFRGTPDETRWFDWILAAGVGVCTWGVLHLAGDWGVSGKLASLALPILLCVRLAGRGMPFALAVAGLLGVATFFPGDRSRALESHRGFFGIHRVACSADGAFNELFHGTTLHGRQRVDPTGRPMPHGEPLTYYHRSGPVGAIMAGLPAASRQNVGVIGLGVGSLAAYGGADDRYTFYEIDPLVRQVADESGRFTYLADARARGAKVDVVLGDARLTLRAAPVGSFDLLVLDAFSGDAIPLHLLTREALATYLDKLAPRGLLAVHISNLYLDLEPVLANLAADAGCVAIRNADLDLTEDQARAGKSPSTWILLGREREHLEPWVRAAGWTDARRHPSSPVWTDDFSNILATIR